MIRMLPFAVALIAAQASAAEPGSTTYNAANGMVYMHHGAGSFVSPRTHKANAPAIVENFATFYPKGLYNASTGASISGPNTLFGQIWLAAGFTPTATATVKEIDVAVAFINGSKNEVLVHLYADAAGIPGTELWSGKASLPNFGDCCAVAAVTDKAKVQVVAGTPYWVGVTTLPKPGDTMAAWDLSTVDQVDSGPAAQDRGTGWVANPATPQFAFGVYGK